MHPNSAFTLAAGHGTVQYGAPTFFSVNMYRSELKHAKSG